jgi:hypothetical protein
MEDKRGTKRECSPSAERSPLPDDAETLPPALYGSSRPPGSLSVALSCRPYSLVFEQGNASRKIPMLDPYSFIADTSRDEEISRKLFSNLNCDILKPPGDGKIIILDDSDDDGEAQEETTTEIESTTVLLLPMMLLQRQGSIIVMIRGPTRRPMVETPVDIAPTILRLLCQKQGDALGVL